MKKNTLSELKDRTVIIATAVFNQLHLIFILLALIFFSVETASAQCTPAGNQTSYGIGSWIAYVYSYADTGNPPSNAFVTYRGFTTQSEIFDYDLGSGSISGTNICGSYSDYFSYRLLMQRTFSPGYYSFTVGGDDGYRLSFDGGATYLINVWNDHGYTTTSANSIYLSGTYNMVLEYYEKGGVSRLSYSYTNCTTSSTAPTSIAGNNSICSGDSTTLTATGGTLGSSGAYQWGTGTTVGSNIISGQTGVSITVSPSSTTTYWVRRIDPAPCSITTSGVTQIVTVNSPSTVPTTISGTTNLCLGNSTTLTASGGTLATGAVYEWGTGTTVGSNIISGQTGASITVTPTSTTTYWVRRTNPSPCSAYTSGISSTVTVNVPAGDQTSYGSGSWIGYVYSAIDTANPPSNAFSTNYRGYVTQSETFDQNIGAGSLSGTNLCGTYADQFSIRFKMRKNFTAGYYTFTVAGDDGYRLSLDGGATFIINNFVDHGYISSTSSQFYLSGNVDLVLEYYEQTGNSQITFSYTSCTNFSTAPTGISGTTALCAGSGTTLSATGGYAAPGATYQWGTGSTVGSNIIAGATAQTYYVAPSSTTTYWVRRIDGSPCNLTTAGVTQTITVSTASTAPTGISGTTTVCRGNSITLTATGGTLAAGGSYQWGTGSTAGSNIITGQTGISISVSPTSSGNYWVRRVDPAPCNTNTSAAFLYIAVSNPSSAPTGISGTTSLCNGSGGTTLTATGGTLGTGSNYQWGTGSTIGSNIIAGATNVSYYINPSTTTTYWVRIVDPAPCSQNTAGVTLTVTVNQPSTQPTTISGTTTICSGQSTTLTVSGGTHGTGAVYQWGTGYSAGSNVITGATGNSITVNPTVQTGYWVRRVDPSPCPATNSGWITTTVNVNPVSTAPTTITPSTTSPCPGTSMTLTASGGTGQSGSTFQWGTGTTIGSNVISGQTSATLSITPSTTTTYWVRRYDSGCNAYTTGITYTVTISTSGNPSSFGNNTWNVYGYSGSDVNLSSTTYIGFYSVSTLNFDTQTGTNSWSNATSPSSSAGWSGCSVPNDNHTFTAKRQGFPCGRYALYMQNWDDVARLYVNGTLVWSANSWSGNGNYNVSVGTFDLDANSTIELRNAEIGGVSNISLTLTNISVASTAPTSITGTTSICSGSTTTLTANGGTTGTNGIFEWGTGTTVGSNTISGATSVSITVSPTSNTTYWVRRVDSLCGTATGGVSQAVTISQAAVAGTLSSTTTTICKNTQPNSIVLSGNTGSVVKWQYANDAAFTSGVTDINTTATTLTGAQIGNVPSTRYFRAVIQSGTCSTVYTAALGITVPATVTYSNGTWNGTPNSTTPVVISGNLTLNSDLNVCSCRITGNSTLTVNSGSNLIVQTSVDVVSNANIILKDKASLVQVDDTASNSGSITAYKKTSPMKQYDYTYWSSPVQNWRLNQLSPNTLSDKYYSFDPIINNWSVISGGNGVMAQGKGYIVRAPQGWSLTNTSSGIYEGSFVGTPNTGVVPVSIQKGAGYMNLIGNPYPSAIDIDLFLTDPTNAGIVNGTIYLWTHNTAISSSIPGNATYNYTSDDYAKYNLTGGIKTASSAITGGVAPDGKIASGQGFFIEANSSLAAGTYTANFKNSMRLANSQNQFYRVTNNGTLTSRTASTAIEKNRLWVNMSNTQGAYNEILLGYVTGATNGFDTLYDGKTLLAGNVLSLYSIQGSDNYSIQGRALPFSDADIIPLGYSTTVAGEFKIALENTDGLFQNQNVYLIDKLYNTVQNLKTGSYTFTTATGTFNTRFELRFNTSALSTEQPTFREESVIVYSQQHQANVHAPSNIQKVSIYDLLGRLLTESDTVHAQDYKSNLLHVATEALIVKITLENGVIVNRKIILE